MNFDWILKTTRTYWGGTFYKKEKAVKEAADLFLNSVRESRKPETHIAEYEIFLAGVNYERSLSENEGG